VRAPLYAEIADISLDTSGQRVRAVATTLVMLVGKHGFAPLQK
jgi:hypothetical protein